MKLNVKNKVLIQEIDKKNIVSRKDGLSSFLYDEYHSQLGNLLLPKVNDSMILCFENPKSVKSINNLDFILDINMYNSLSKEQLALKMKSFKQQYDFAVYKCNINRSYQYLLLSKKLEYIIRSLQNYINNKEVIDAAFANYQYYLELVDKMHMFYNYCLKDENIVQEELINLMSRRIEDKQLTKKIDRIIQNDIEKPDGD